MQRNALLSVFHKDGIVEFAQELVALGWRIISSDGTTRTLRQGGVETTDIADISGMPPVLGHRVVTLVPQIHGGLMASEEQRAELKELGYSWIDLACVDLYPLEDEIAKPCATLKSVNENTDIGGPALIRSAAKGGRIVIVDPRDRVRVLRWFKEGEPNAKDFRRKLAANAELVVAQYCLKSAWYLATH